MSKQYEIGLVQFFDGLAIQIVGPFPDRTSACDEATKRNREEGRKLPPGHGSWGWMFAEWGEMKRGGHCIVTEPPQSLAVPSLQQVIDVTQAQQVQIVLGAEGQVWVNVDGVCRFRSAQGLNVVVDDRRPQVACGECCGTGIDPNCRNARCMECEGKGVVKKAKVVSIKQ